MDYLLLKSLHIVSATILFGTGIGSAFYMFMANRTKDVAAIRFATRHVVLADWLFTSPAILVQFTTGWALANEIGVPLTSGWLMWALLLFLFAGACWLPVVWLQIEMQRMAEHAFAEACDLPKRYWRFARVWTLLGCLAFPAVLIMVYLMVAKPS